MQLIVTVDLSDGDRDERVGSTLLFRKMNQMTMTHTAAHEHAAKPDGVRRLSWSQIDEGERLLRIKQVMVILGISRATIYRYVANGKLPSPVKLSVRCVAWKASVIAEWIEALSAERKPTRS